MKLFTGWIKPNSENPGTARLQSRAGTLLPVLILLSILISAASLGTALLLGSLSPLIYFFLAALPLLLAAGLLFRIEFKGVASLLLVLTLISLFLGIVYSSAPVYLIVLALFIINASSTYMFGLLPAVLIIILSQGLYLSAGWFAGGLNIPIPPAPPGMDQIGLQTGILVFSAFLLDLFLQNPSRPGSAVHELRSSRDQEEPEIPVEHEEDVPSPVKHHTPGEIARLAASAAAPEEVVTAACELIQKIADYYLVAIYLLDESETWAEIAAGTGTIGQILKTRQYRLAVGSASLIGWVTANRLPRIAQDVSRDPFFFKHPLLPESKSELVYPLLIGERLIGVLDVQSAEPRAFTGENLRILEAAGNELAIAIENARLLSETRLRLERIEREYTEQSMESWQRILRAAPSQEYRKGLAPQSDTRTLEEMIDRAASIRHTYIDSERKAVAVPIRVRGQTIATIALRKQEQEEPWTDDDIALIEALSSQASLALETARQYNEEQRRVAELEVINRISQAVSQLLRLDSLYRVVHTQLKQVLGNIDLTIGLYNSSSGLLSIPYSTQNQQSIEIQPLDPEHNALGAVLSNRQPILLLSHTEFKVALAETADALPKAQSWLGVPMLFGNEVIGLIAIHDPEHEQRFTDDDTALLTTISSQVATAIQNTSLLQQIRSSARREQLIREITTSIRRAPDIQSILDTSVKELGRALNVSLASIQLGIPRQDQNQDDH
jgi:GAF domain-containing protein